MLFLTFTLIACALASPLQTWLESRGGLTKKIQISEINGSPVVIASKLINEGDVILTIPRDQIVISNKTPKHINKEVVEDIDSPVFKLAFYFLDQLENKEVSASYRDYIKACGFTHNPAVLWEDKTIELLKGSPVAGLAKDGKEDIKAIFKEYKEKSKGGLLSKGRWNDISDAMRIVLVHTVEFKDKTTGKDELMFIPLLGILRNPSEYSNEKGNTRFEIPEDENEPIRLVAKETIPILGEITVDLSNIKNTDEGEEGGNETDGEKDKKNQKKRVEGSSNSTILMRSGRVIGRINTGLDEKPSKSVVTDNDITNIFDIYLLHFNPNSGKKSDANNDKNKNEEEENKDEGAEELDIVKELKQALLKASNLPSGTATIAISKGEMEMDVKQEIKGVPDALLVMLRIHLAKSEEFGKIGNALKGRPLSLENELIVSRSLVTTIQNILDGYEHTIQEDLTSYSELLKKFMSDDSKNNYKMGEKLSALKYTLVERELLITVGRNVQFHWMRFLEV